MTIKLNHTIVHSKDPQAAASAGPDPALAAQAEALASRLEMLAETLEREAPTP